MLMSDLFVVHIAIFFLSLRFILWSFVSLSRCLKCLQITLPYEAPQLSKATRSTAAIYLACGIDSSKVCFTYLHYMMMFVAGALVELNVLCCFVSLQASIFVQSHVRAHVELMWLLSSSTPIGWLNRMIQFKEKSRKAVRHSLYDSFTIIFCLS
jgi:tryptophanyl-tRNA synthetase